MKSPRVFTQNLSIHTVNTDSKKYLVFMQKTDLGIYSVAEEIHRKWSPTDLKENAMMYFDRFKTKQTNAKILKVVSTKVQGWPDVRLDGQCTIQGSTMLFTWLGFRDGDTSWIVKAHYVEYNQSIAKAESMMASIAISDN